MFIAFTIFLCDVRLWREGQGRIERDVAVHVHVFYDSDLCT
jgi:hypothetical protein